MTTESRLAQEKRGVAAELQRARDAAAEQAARHEHRVAELQQTHDARFAALHDRHRALQSEMAALQASIPAAAGGAVGVAEVETTLESERRAAEETRLKNLELDLNEHHATEYENLERTKDGQIKNLKDQTAYFLAKKDDELRALALEHDNYRREKEAECERLHEECEYLHGWAMSMNSVLENVESGAYPVVEAGGLRTLTIPVDGKPGSLDVPSLAARAEDARRFLEETSTLDKYAATGRSENIETAGKTTSGSRLARTTTSSAADAFELEAFKTHGDLIDAERAAVADATLRELSSHPTVEYIRHLEEENARITSQLSRATRSVSDMRIALNSAVRQVNARSTAAPLAAGGGATLSRVSSARGGDGTPGSAPPLASRPAPRSSGLLTSALKNRDPLDVAFGTTKSNAATSGPFRDVETNALVHTHRAGLHKTNAYASGGARPAYLTQSNEPAYKTATNYHPAGDGPHKPRTHRTAAFGLNASEPGRRSNATSTLERASVGVLNDRAVEAREKADAPTRLARAEARAAEREERERTRGVRSFLETQASTGSRVNGRLGASTIVGGVETIGELNAARDEALRSYARENRVASHRSRGRDPRINAAAPLGGASGRLASDRVPLPGRPISGTAEVGYGWVLGDGVDKDGGTVGWPARGPGSTGVDLSRSSDGSHVATAANALEGSAWRNAPGAAAFGVAGKIGEQRGDGVRSAMMMVPAEVVPAAGAPTPAVEPPPGA